MKIKVWGARGSIPSPLKPEGVRAKIHQAILGLPDINTKDPQAVDAYLDQLPHLLTGTAGGNTTCIQIQAGSETIIIDAGSGLRELGLELMKGACGRGKGKLHFLFTHSHWDHVQGFPFFIPAFVPGNQIFIHSVHNLKLALEEQQRPLWFPVPVSYMQAALQFLPITPGEAFEIGKLKINSIKTAHPGDAYAYRFDDGDNSFVFASDAEYKQLDEASLRPYIEFFHQADVLFFDAQYTLEEALQKIDWGHSSAMIGADIARMAEVKRLVLFHHDPTYSDDDLLHIQKSTIEYQAQDSQQSPCEVIVAYEGLAFDLSPAGKIDLQRLTGGQEAILTPSGSFDEQGISTLQKQLEHWERVGWPSRLVIDLSETESLSIAGLKSLISLRKEKPGTVIALAGLSESVKQVIDLAGFSNYFAVYPTAEAARAALQAAETLNLPGQFIDQRYRIERRLGDSWQGAVFQATDIYNNRSVALTIFSSSFSEHAIKELVRQSHKLKDLSHPNLANLLDQGEYQGFYYVVEELISGVSLHELLGNLEGEPYLSVDRARDISLGILNALEFVHSRGIIHYNLTPRNIFVNGDVKLTNFGLAALEQGRQLLEHPLIALEAPYLAPEQILGQRPDARADLYALGTIMYQLFTGRPPFSGSDHEIMQAHLTQMPEPPSNLNPLLSRPLEYLILKLLAKNPDDRYATAHQTRQILSSINVGEHENAGLPDLLYRNTLPLVNRAEELQQLEAARDSVEASGKPHLVIVRGEMGIGKSRLVSEFLLNSIVDYHFTAIMGDCDELGAPYTPYAQILTTIFNRGFVNPQAIAGNVRHLTLQIPSLASTLSPFQGDSPAQSGNPQRAQWYFFETVLLVLSYLGPSVLFIDDAAYMDDASIALTRFLIRRGQLPFLIVIAGRDDEETNPWLSAFPIDNLTVVNVPPLSQAVIEEYLEHLIEGTVSKNVVATIEKRTHGNPYFINELTQHFIDKGVLRQRDSGMWDYENGAVGTLPDNLMQIFSRRMEKLAESRRLEDLTESARQALGIAAIIGAEFEVDTWIATLKTTGGIQKSVALDMLDEAETLHLVHPLGATHYAFESVDIADVLASSLPKSWQRNVHRSIAEILKQQDANPLTISYHYQQAELTAQAAQCLETAGARAVVAQALDEAITYYDQAVLLAESQSRYETLGDLYCKRGAYAEATRAYQQALKMVKQTDTVARARNLNGLAMASWMYNNLEEAREAATEVLNLSDIPQIEYATAKSHLGMIAWMMGRLDEAEDWCEQSLEGFAGSEDQDRLATIHNWLGLVYASKCKFEQATEALNTSLEIRRPLNDHWGEALCLNNLARVAVDQGQFDKAYALFASAQQLFEDIESSGGLMILYRNIGKALVLQHQPEAALQNLREALEHAEKLREPSAHTLGGIYLFLAQAYLDTGNLEQARENMNKGLSLVEDVKSLGQTAVARATLAQIHEAEKDYATAEVLYHTAINLFERMGALAGLMRTRLAYAQFLAKAGRSAEADDLEQKTRKKANQLGLYL